MMVFPEGTRSLDGEVKSFHDGAFRLAVDAGVPILPVIVDGTFNCLPKKSWKFGRATAIKVEVLDPVETSGYKRGDIPALRESVRETIRENLARIRGQEVV